jgi:hypothetical protein
VCVCLVFFPCFALCMPLGTDEPGLFLNRLPDGAFPNRQLGITTPGFAVPSHHARPRVVLLAGDFQCEIPDVSYSTVQERGGGHAGMRRCIPCFPSPSGLGSEPLIRFGRVETTAKLRRETTGIVLWLLAKVFCCRFLPQEACGSQPALTKPRRANGASSPRYEARGSCVVAAVPTSQQLRSRFAILLCMRSRL